MLRVAVCQPICGSISNNRVWNTRSIIDSYSWRCQRRSSRQPEVDE